LQGRGRVGRGGYENTAVPEIDVSDKPGARANSHRAPCVVDLQLDRWEAFDRGEDCLDGLRHRDETSGCRAE
jgi:hypothetical protein